MKYPGRPESTAPHWYRDRGPSPIEESFSKELAELANTIEREHWFGDAEKHGRYRVDFILKDARLIIELDGHEHHSTKDQLMRDAIRQRYLTRAGYDVIRFTGREVFRNAARCVAEVRQIYTERMQHAPAKYRVLYVDYVFFERQQASALEFYRSLHPNKSLQPVSLDKFIPHAIDWLVEKSFITAFVFHPTRCEDELRSLNNFIKEYDRGEVRINTLSTDLYTADLGDHMQSFAHLYDEFFLIADDPIYAAPFLSVLPEKPFQEKLGKHTFEYIGNGKLLRLGNDETSYVGTDLVKVKWQDVWYSLGTALGLEVYEL
ncbi:very-short-patch-repair endonuclease [Paraburkholderia sp. RAU6.4a]|uniref:endonuclease domain-containing protein n=1 Tax=Paraburkholderia sp. RAU6.4a TaxID=2991067 RepID=UPI003D1C6941